MGAQGGLDGRGLAHKQDLGDCGIFLKRLEPEVGRFLEHQLLHDGNDLVAQLGDHDAQIAASGVDRLDVVLVEVVLEHPLDDGPLPVPRREEAAHRLALALREAAETGSSLDYPVQIQQGAAWQSSPEAAPPTNESSHRLKPRKSTCDKMKIFSK